MKEGRKLFQDLAIDDRRAVRRDAAQMAVNALLAIAAWMLALHLADAQQADLEQVREQTRLQVHAKAKIEAAQDAQAYWVPRVAHAYEQGARDECERQRLVSASHVACGVQ